MSESKRDLLSNGALNFQLLISGSRNIFQVDEGGIKNEQMASKGLIKITSFTKFY